MKQLQSPSLCPLAPSLPPFRSLGCSGTPIAVEVFVQFVRLRTAKPQRFVYIQISLCVVLELVWVLLLHCALLRLVSVV